MISIFNFLFGGSSSRSEMAGFGDDTTAAPPSSSSSPPSSTTAAADTAASPGPYVPITQPFHVEAVEVPRFEPDDPLMPVYLEEHGYVVVRGVASPEEVQRATNLLWDFLTKTTGMQRNDPSTWDDAHFCKVGSIMSGILNAQGVGQSDFLWYLRLLPRVKASFQHIFGESDLICSFDGGNVYRPWHAPGTSPYCKTQGAWYHVDQGRTLRGRCAVQGLVALTDATAETGGFCVIPDSQKHHDRLIEESKLKKDVNFIQVRPDFDILKEKQILPLCRAGDLVLWDSRTIHCNTPSLVPPQLPTDRLLRAVGYVCMVPASMASPDVLDARRDAFEAGETTNHWPQFVRKAEHSSGRKRIKRLEDVSREQKLLVVGEAYVV